MSNSPHPEFSWTRVGRILLGLVDATLAVATVGLASFSIGLLFARLHWTIDNATSFELVYFAAGIALVVVTAIRRRRVVLGIAFVVAVYHASHVVPYYVPTPRASASGASFRMMSANLQWDSQKPQRIYDVIRQESPDILALQEVTPARLEELERLRAEYPYWAHCVGNNMLGVALLSKIPLADTNDSWVTHGVYPTLMAEAEINGTQTSIVVTHTVPPFSAEWTRRRDAQLIEIADRISDRRGPCIVVGDLNATMWTPSFRDFVGIAKLKNARRGFGVLPTYSSGYKRLIPIDHVLYRGDFSVTACRVGADAGSDHRPLIVDMAAAVK